jgi:UDP-N-acetylglucosamine 2-epimerase (non-hydrolysing)
MKKKILVILGTRPEIIRLSCIVKKLDKFFLTIVLNTNQNFDKNLNKNFFRELRISLPKYNLNYKKKHKTPMQFISSLILETDKILEVEKPDAVLILGDTNSGLSAICAKRRKIPIFHIEAGNRSFDQRVPEEVNRKLIDHISDINMTYSDVAKLNLIKENFDLDKIIKIGSPLNEVFKKYESNIKNSLILKKLNLIKNKYLLVSCHREENIDDYKNLNNIFLALKYISKKYKIKIIFSTHPRLKSKLKKFNKSFLKNINFYKPFSFFDYINLQINSALTISDSGSIVEESNILNFPAINLRNTTERQEGMEKGSVIMTSLDVNSIIESAKIILEKNKNDNLEKNVNIHLDYLDSNVSEKVLIIIQSYINYINSRTWFK